MGKRKSEKVILGKIGKIILKNAKKYFNKICIVGHNEYDPMEDDCREVADKIIRLVKEQIMFRCSKCIFGYKEHSCPMHNRCAEAEIQLLRNLSEL